MTQLRTEPMSGIVGRIRAADCGPTTIADKAVRVSFSDRRQRTMIAIIRMLDAAIYSLTPK